MHLCRRVERITRWRVGLGLSTFAGFAIGLKTGSFVTGTLGSIAGIAGFSLVRSVLRPWALRTSLKQGIRMEPPQSLASFLLPESYRDVLRAIEELFDRVERRRFVDSGKIGVFPEFSNLWLLATTESGLMAEKLGEDSAFSRQKVPSDLDLNLVGDALKMANAAYGFLFCSAMGLIDSKKAFEIARTSKSVEESDKENFEACFGRKLDFAYTSPHYADLYAPKCYIILDHERKRIFLTIRGTSSFSDILLDLSVNLDPVEELGDGTRCHRGMLLGARSVLRECEKILHMKKDAFPDYEFILSGHSLGGGACIATHALLQTKDEKIRPKASFAFGAPPIFTETNCFEDLHIISNGRDIVPKLSLWSTDRLFQKIERIDKLIKSGKLSHLARFRALWSGWEGLSLPEQNLLKETFFLKKDSFLEEDDEDWKLNCVPLRHGGRHFVIAGERRIETLDDFYSSMDICVDVSAFFLSDHLPINYHRRFFEKSLTA